MKKINIFLMFLYHIFCTLGMKDTFKFNINRIMYSYFLWILYLFKLYELNKYLSNNFSFILIILCVLQKVKMSYFP